MSKIIVYILDKFVWMLVGTVFTTQALQIAGIIDAPKALGDIEYTQNNEFEYGLQVGDADARGKRQTGDRSPLIDNIFNIPIATINAVNDLVQSARPAFQRLRESAQKRLEAANQASAAYQALNTKTKRQPLSMYGHNPRVQPNESNSKK